MSCSMKEKGNRAPYAQRREGQTVCDQEIKGSQTQSVRSAATPRMTKWSIYEKEESIKCHPIDILAKI